MSERKALIEIRHLKKYFPVKDFLEQKSFVKAVDDVSFDIYKGETFGLVGESGCGKSTLGRTIIRMYEPTDGTLIYDGKDISTLKRSQMKEVAGRMQIIFQDPYSSLNPHWNVREIIEEPLKQTGMDKEARYERTLYLLEKVGMQRSDMDKFPFEFSGGQRQRIGIARAISVNPEFVMCDEPISALDVSIQAQVVNMLEDLQEEMGLTYLFAAHDLSMVKYISHRIGVMYLGALVELAPSKVLYERPLHPYTKALLSAIPEADPQAARKNKRIPLEGEQPSPIEVQQGCRFASRCAYAVARCREEMPEPEELETGHMVACHRAEELN